MVAIPIGVQPPTAGWPTLSFPAFPTTQYCIGPGGNSWQSCLTLPNFGGLLGWIYGCIAALFAWIAELILTAINWAIYYLVAAILGLVSLLVNGALSLVMLYWSAASSLAAFTGPFAPVTASVLVGVFATGTILVVLLVASFGFRLVGRFVSEVEGPSSTGSEGESGVADLAEVAA